MSQKVKPKDIIAVLVIFAWVFAKYIHIDTVIDGALMLVLGYYFVKRVEGKDNGQ